MRYYAGACSALFAACLALTASVSAYAADAAAPAEPTPEEAAAAAVIADARAAINITAAWTRATPGNATNAAVYLRISNNGTEPERLIGVRAAMAERAEIHTGGATMAAVEGLDVPAGETLAFAPNDNHIMLIDLRAPLLEGDSFLVQLEFEKGGSQTIAVPVGTANAMAPPLVSAGNAEDITSGATEEPADDSAPQ